MWCKENARKLVVCSWVFCTSHIFVPWARKCQFHDVFGLDDELLALVPQSSFSIGSAALRARAAAKCLSCICGYISVGSFLLVVDGVHSSCLLCLRRTHSWLFPSCSLSGHGSGHVPSMWLGDNFVVSVLFSWQVRGIIPFFLRTTLYFAHAYKVSTTILPFLYV